MHHPPSHQSQGSQSSIIIAFEKNAVYTAKAALSVHLLTKAKCQLSPPPLRCIAKQRRRRKALTHFQGLVCLFDCCVYSAFHLPLEYTRESWKTAPICHNVKVRLSDFRPPSKHVKSRVVVQKLLLSALTRLAAAAGNIKNAKIAIKSAENSILPAFKDKLGKLLSTYV